MDDFDLIQIKSTGRLFHSGYILEECRQEMAALIHDIIECSLKTGKNPYIMKMS